LWPVSSLGTQASASLLFENDSRIGLAAVGFKVQAAAKAEARETCEKGKEK